MDWAFLYNSFEGRIGRQTFWIAVAVLGVIEFAAHFAAEQMQGDRLSAIVDLAFVYPEFAVAVKRAHDRNMPVVFLIVFFAGSAVLDLLAVTGNGRHRGSADDHRDADRGAVHDPGAVPAGRARLPQRRRWA